MLTLHLNSAYDVTDVPVKIGTYEGGQHQEVTVKMDFRIPAGFTRAMLHHQTKENEAEFYEQLITDWRGVCDEHGEAIPCHGEIKKAVLKNERVLYGVLQSMTSILLGVPLAKNSEAGSAS